MRFVILTLLVQGGSIESTKWSLNVFWKIKSCQKTSKGKKNCFDDFSDTEKNIINDSTMELLGPLKVRSTKSLRISFTKFWNGQAWKLFQMISQVVEITLGDPKECMSLE